MVRSVVQVVSAVLVLAAASDVRAEVRRAVVVGIGRYPAGPARGARGAWASLDGPVNDAEAFRDVLVARYGFRPSDVVLLRDGEATREGILAALQRVLVEPARAGDLSVLYFAGHGSWVPNSLSPEPDRRDETIVPVDGRDIRDKELARALGAAAVRGVRVTAIFDSCHSGSIARGLAPPRVVRAVPPAPRADVRDPEPAPTPVQSGVLVLAAARDDQGATEVLDEAGEHHGAFTAALLQVLRTAPLDSDADAVLARTRAALAVSGAVQEPVLDGPAWRREAPLFGGLASGGRGRTVVAVAAARGEEVEVLGGFSVGLAPGAILAKAGTDGAAPLRFRVSEVRGPSRAIARAIDPGPGAAPAAGDLLEVERWAVDSTARLRVHLGPTLPLAEIREVARRLAPLRRAPGLAWVDDPAATAPTHVLHFAASGWRLRHPDGRDERIGFAPGAAEVAGRIARTRARPALFVHLPIAEEVAAALRTGAEADEPSVRTPSAADALYLLAGRAGPGGAPEYAWVLARPLAADRAGLPQRSAWHPIASGAEVTAAALDDAVLRIARVRAWLTVEPPPGEEPFPYRLAVRRAGTPAVLAQGTVLRGGETYEAVLVATPATLARGGSPVRHVHVLVLDAAGGVNVLFPADGAGVDHRLPVVAPGRALPVEVPLGERGTFRIGPPYGTDVYVLLATAEPIPSIGRLAQAGVMRAGRDAVDPLTELLAGLGRSRGAGRPLPGGWSIDRVAFRSER